MTQQEDLTYINKKMSAAFLLANMAFTCIEDAEERAQKFGGFKHELKLYLKRGKKGLEEYMSIIRKEADRQGKTLDFFHDFEELEKRIKEFIEE